MDNIYYERLLYRILQGRLKLRLNDGPVLFIEEPTMDLLEESLEAYDEAYKQAYYSNVPIKEELIDTLLENNLWSPLDDKEAEQLEKKLEDMKVEAFEKFYDKRFVNSKKMQIRQIEDRINKLRFKKMVLDHTSCEGSASFSRQLWILNRTTFYSNGRPYDWADITVHGVFDYYVESNIKDENIRYLARNNPWRQMWSTGKKTGELFRRHTVDLTKDQKILAHYSTMYDNIYEHPESPNDKVIEDDDCLDGWIIKQRRENEKNKKQKEVDGLIGNSKIANAQEVFVMARDQESASEIYDLNNPLARKTIRERNQQIQNAEGDLNFKDLHDVKQDIQIQSRQQAMQGAKKRGRR